MDFESFVYDYRVVKKFLQFAKFPRNFLRNFLETFLTNSFPPVEPFGNECRKRFLEISLEISRNQVSSSISRFLEISFYFFLFLGKFLRKFLGNYGKDFSFLSIYIRNFRNEKCLEMKEISNFLRNVSHIVRNDS